MKAEEGVSRERDLAPGWCNYHVWKTSPLQGEGAECFGCLSLGVSPQQPCRQDEAWLQGD